MRGPATVNELAKPFDMSQQAVSKHLAYLEHARLIEKQRKGRERLCALRPNAIKKIADWADGYRGFWDGSFQRLDGVLAAMVKKEKKHGR